MEEVATFAEIHKVHPGSLKTEYHFGRLQLAEHLARGYTDRESNLKETLARQQDAIILKHFEIWVAKTWVILNDNAKVTMARLYSRNSPSINYAASHRRYDFYHPSVTKQGLI